MLKHFRENAAVEQYFRLSEINNSKRDSLTCLESLLLNRLQANSLRIEIQPGDFQLKNNRLDINLNLYALENTSAFITPGQIKYLKNNFDFLGNVFNPLRQITDLPMFFDLVGGRINKMFLQAETSHLYEIIDHLNTYHKHDEETALQNIRNVHGLVSSWLNKPALRPISCIQCVMDFSENKIGMMVMTTREDFRSRQLQIILQLLLLSLFKPKKLEYVHVIQPLRKKFVHDPRLPLITSRRYIQEEESIYGDVNLALVNYFVEYPEKIIIENKFSI